MSPSEEARVMFTSHVLSSWLAHDDGMLHGSSWNSSKSGSAVSHDDEPFPVARSTHCFNVHVGVSWA